jgi:transcriptional regulator with XRE-family HTH domain
MTLEMTQPIPKQKDPSDADRHIGNRIKQRRLALKMSQEKLGDALGITFQQVQKYERGTNRVGAGRLQHIAMVLGVHAAYFFEGLPEPGKHTTSGTHDLGAVLSLPDGVRLLELFLGIDDESIQQKVVDVVESVLKLNAA